MFSIVLWKFFFCRCSQERLFANVQHRLATLLLLGRVCLRGTRVFWRPKTLDFFFTASSQVRCVASLPTASRGTVGSHRSSTAAPAPAASSFSPLAVMAMGAPPRPSTTASYDTGTLTTTLSTSLAPPSGRLASPEPLLSPSELAKKRGIEKARGRVVVIQRDLLLWKRRRQVSWPAFFLSFLCVHAKTSISISDILLRPF